MSSLAARRGLGLKLASAERDLPPPRKSATINADSPKGSSPTGTEIATPKIPLDLASPKVPFVDDDPSSPKLRSGCLRSSLGGRSAADLASPKLAPTPPLWVPEEESGDGSGSDWSEESSPRSEKSEELGTSAKDAATVNSVASEADDFMLVGASPSPKSPASPLASPSANPLTSPPGDGHGKALPASRAPERSSSEDRAEGNGSERPAVAMACSMAQVQLKGLGEAILALKRLREAQREALLRLRGAK